MVIGPAAIIGRKTESGGGMVGVVLSHQEAEMLGSQLVRRARENGAEPYILDRGSSIHEEGACLVLLDERERAMISNAFFKGRKKNKAVAALLKKVRWMI